jgi:hypothetical protein
MMIALLERAQVERIARLGRHQIAEAIDVECARSRNVAHAERNVAGAHHIEWRIEDGRTDRHGLLQALTAPRARNTCVARN